MNWGRFPLLDPFWGFWPDNTWIGPRHTNFPDGSICSFEPADCTWVPGDSIVALLDLHTLWSLRHLHLAVFNKWPAQQCVRHSYERIPELEPDEMCGCDSAKGKSYSKCCQAKDLEKNRVRAAITFSLTDNGSIRQPPSSIRKVLQTFHNPPQPDLNGCFA